MWRKLKSNTIQGIIYISGTLHKSAVSDVQRGSGREGGSGEGGVMEGGDDGSLPSLIYIDGIKTTPLSGEAMHASNIIC